MTKNRSRRIASKKSEVSECNSHFELEPFIDALRTTNEEVLQMEELRAQIEKLKGGLISYFIGILKRYSLNLRVSAESISGGGGEGTLHVDETGIVSHHFLDGSVKSRELMKYSPSDLLGLFNAMMPPLRMALRLKREEYENVSRLLARIRETMVSLKGRPVDRSGLLELTSKQQHRKKEAVTKSMFIGDTE